MTVALCIGGAEGWRAEVEAVEAMVGGAWPGPVLACNDAASEVEPLDHFCTLHAEKLPKWRRIRHEAGRSMHFETWSCARRSVIDHHWDDWTDGSSGLYMVGVALVRLGCPGALVCGVPLDRRPNHFSRRAWKPRAYFRGWGNTDKHPERFEFLSRRLRSMSGWTRERFGAPTPEWIAGMGLDPPGCFSVA